MPPAKNKIKQGNRLKEPAKKSTAKKVSGKKKASSIKVTSKKPKTQRKVDPRVWRIVGFLSILLSFYLVLSFISFFINWFDSNPDMKVNQTFQITQYFSDHARIVQSWTGKTGSELSHFLVLNGFGIGAFFIAVLFFEIGVRMMVKFKLLRKWRLFEGMVISLLWLPLLMAMIFPVHPDNIMGGLMGHQINVWMSQYVGNVGEIFILIFVLAIFILIDYQFSFVRKKKKKQQKQKAKEEKEAAEHSTDHPSDKYNTVEFSVEEEVRDFDKNEGNTIPELETIYEPEFKAEVIDTSKQKKQTDNAGQPEEIELTVEAGSKEKEVKSPVKPGDHLGIDSDFDPRLDLPDYKFPHLDLLERYDSEGVVIDREELEANKLKIVETLKNYSISIVKIKATIGPTVTLYEIVPAPGVRISKIKNLEDDIALSLAAMGIRIIAPIPGKGTVGIEVPNKNPTIVSMRSVLASERFQNSKFDLPLALGKTISNTSFVVDLAKMPHILMAGATGQGKSVGLNAIIASLLYKKHPAELKFVLVDPKKVELTLFSRIERHFLAKLPDSEESIITDTRKVVRTLNSLGIEMDNRYELLKDAQVRNIKEYNAKFIKRKLNPLHGHRYLPYIVLVVDEFADLIMTAGKEVENPITRLAQLARAVGIHLIIATQRPSVNIITGTIKANFPARIAFRVISKIDSRTILDNSGADQLVGRGDMLLSTGSDLIRLQCAFIDTPEVETVTDYIGSQRGYPDAMHLPEFVDEEAEAKEDFDANDRDPLFEDAAQIIVQTQQGSTSLLQRKLKLGYNRAGRIIDQLEAAGIVGPFEGSKAREVRVANEMALEQFLKDLNMH
ncbi:MAG: DNA translocase FtsK, partial [Bacteroidetes bacterium]